VRGWSSEALPVLRFIVSISVVLFFNNLCQFWWYYFWPLIVLILFCKFAMASSGLELDLDFLTKRKDNVKVPQGIDTPMCFCGGARFWSTPTG
jgi:hypothetical protein